MSGILQFVGRCNLCNSSADHFTEVKTKRTEEWDGVKQWCKSLANLYNSDFLKIPDTFNIYKCKQCGLQFVNPRLNSTILHKFYNLYLGGAFSDFLPTYDFQFRETMFKIYLSELLKRNPHAKSLLDIGCAYGGMMKVARAQGLYAEGIEVAEMAAYSAEQFGVVHIGEVLEVLPRIGRRVDFITLSDSLEHMPYPIEVLRLCREKLGNDGNMFIEVPNANSGLDEMSRHLFLFTEETLRKAVVDVAGFSSIVFLDLGLQKYGAADPHDEGRFIRAIAKR